MLHKIMCSGDNFIDNKSHLESKYLTFYRCILQDDTNASDVEEDTNKAHPKRLRSLDTFRGYVWKKKNSVLYISSSALVPRPHGYCPQSCLGHDEDAQLRYNE